MVMLAHIIIKVSGIGRGREAPLDILTPELISLVKSVHLSDARAVDSAFIADT